MYGPYKALNHSRRLHFNSSLLSNTVTFLQTDINMPQLNKTIFGGAPDLSDDEKNTIEVVKNVRTTPRDARFTSQNQANHCWNRYNEWLLCLKNTGDEEGCKNMKQMAFSICPSLWTEKWEEEREENTFTGLKL